MRCCNVRICSTFRLQDAAIHCKTQQCSTKALQRVVWSHTVHVKVQELHSIAQVFGSCGSNFQTKWTQKLPYPDANLIPRPISAKQVCLEKGRKQSVEEVKSLQ